MNSREAVNAEGRATSLSGVKAYDFQMKYKAAFTNPDIHPLEDWAIKLMRECDAELKAKACYRREEIVDLCADADAVLVTGSVFDAEVIGCLRHCRIISRIGTGCDNIDLAAAGAAGIPVVNVPEWCTDEVADQAMALLLACARRLPEGDKLLREGVWDQMYVMPAHSLRGQVMGLVGFGRIARAVARRAEAFGMRNVYYDPFVSETGGGDLATACKSLDELLGMADVVSLHAPLTDETRGMIGRAQLRLMKPTSFLINTGRGKLVVQEELIAALKEGVIAGAGLDAHEPEPLPKDSPLIELSNVVMSPHCAAHTVEALREAAVQAYEQVARAFRGQPLSNVVNQEFLKSRKT